MIIVFKMDVMTMDKKERMKELFLDIQQLEGKELLRGHILYYAGPTIVGVKPATIMTLADTKGLKKLWLTHGEELCEEYNINYYVLKEAAHKLTIMLYHPISLEVTLQREEHSHFLKQFGYKKEESLTNKIQRLADRFESLCPHEMGIFLGFPLDEVVAYMECPGRQCLLCGYWKVYNNIKIAQQAFDLYDDIRLRMLQNLINQNVKPLYVE